MTCFPHPAVVSAIGVVLRHMSCRRQISRLQTQQRQLERARLSWTIWCWGSAAHGIGLPLARRDQMQYGFYIDEQTQHACKDLRPAAARHAMACLSVLSNRQQRRSLHFLQRWEASPTHCLA